jgi:Xaa-Pro dipeptidase
VGQKKQIDTQARFNKLQGILQESGYDVAALVPSPHLVYLTGVGFRMMERPVVMFVPAQGEAVMVIPELELPPIKHVEPFPINFISYNDTQGSLPAFEKACQMLQLAGKRIAVEGLKMRYWEGQTIHNYAPGSTLDSADDVLMKLRLNKDNDEVASLRRAIQMSETALEKTLAQVRPGMTERQIENILVAAMTAEGGEGNSFSPIVAGGPNAANPHGHTSDRPIREGEVLLFDYGTLYDGYAADITRTFAVGQLDPEMTRVYETVLAANMAALKAAGPGVSAQEVDRAARKVITEAGYGDFFLHRTGHGLGMDVHEGPYIREGNEQILEPGMIFTIEPGVYLAGKGGVRIEDDVVITETGAESLTTFPKALRVIGK